MASTQAGSTPQDKLNEVALLSLCLSQAACLYGIATKLKCCVLDAEPEGNVLKEIAVEDNVLVPDSEAPAPKTKRKASFKAALQNFTTALGSELFTPGLLRTSLSRGGSLSRSSILNGESAAELPMRQLSLEGDTAGRQQENGEH